MDNFDIKLTFVLLFTVGYVICIILLISINKWSLLSINSDTTEDIALPFVYVGGSQESRF